MATQTIYLTNISVFQFPLGNNRSRAVWPMAYPAVETTELPVLTQVEQTTPVAANLVLQLESNEQNITLVYNVFIVGICCETASKNAVIISR